jgi:thiamine-phosphate pyrophosphorylase
MTAPRLMLVSPVLTAASDIATAFAEAIGAAEFAAVILRVEPEADERAILKILKPLVAAAQETGAAVLIQGMPDLVGKSGADGVHALGEKQAREAAGRFKPEKIVGAGGLRTRDAAMTAGELGVDYVLFGDPGKGGEAPPLDATLERLSWWVEIFNTPCVGQAETADAVMPIAETGAEFVALGAFVWTDSSGPADAVRRAAGLIPAETAA